MNLRTHTTTAGQIITYGSTNRWFRFALAWLETQAFAGRVSRAGVVTYDSLLPRVLDDLGYQPARTIMEQWASAFFPDEPVGLFPSDVPRQLGEIEFGSFEHEDALRWWSVLREDEHDPTSSPTTLTQDGTRARYVTHSMCMTIGDDRDHIAEYGPVRDRRNEADEVIGVNIGMEVRPGRRYSGSVMALEPGRARVGIRWLDANNRELSRAYGEPGPSSTTWTRLHVTAEAPSEPATARATFLVDVIGAAPAEKHYFDGALFAEGAPFDFFTAYSQHDLRMLRRMTDFLRWYPRAVYTERLDPVPIGVCIAWADAFYGERPGTHRVNTAGPQDPPSWHPWRLYRYVETNPEEDRRTNDDLPESVLDGAICKAHHLAEAAQAFESLAGRLDADGDHPDRVRDYRRFARRSTRALWDDRGAWNQDRPTTWLLFDKTHSSRGPLYTDAVPAAPRRDADDYVLPIPTREGVPQGDGTTHDTDSLYWARILYRLYNDHDGSERTDLIPPQDRRLPRFHPDGRRRLSLLPYRRQDAIDRRRRILAPLVDAATSPDPGVDQYLYMALAMTLDWMRGGWNSTGRHFVRKVYRQNGTSASTLMYGDGSYNTLYMLTWAYRFTADPLYLYEFRTAWQTFKDTAGQLSYWVVNNENRRFDRWIEWRVDQQRHLWKLDISGEHGRAGRRGLFHALKIGQLDSGRWDADWDVGGDLIEQDPFLDVMIDAHRAVTDKGVRTNWYLDEAQRFADVIMAKYSVVEEEYETASITQLVPGNVLKGDFAATAFLRLAAAESLIDRGRGVRPVEFRVPEGARLTFTLTAYPDRSPARPPDRDPATVEVRRTSALIYMNRGTYDLDIRWQGPRHRPEEVTAQGDLLVPRTPYRHDSGWSSAGFTVTVT